MTTEQKDVLEQNVSSLIESGGERPRIADAARSRIKSELVAKFAVAAAPAPRAVTRTPMFAVGLGLAAATAIGLIATKLIGSGHDATTTTAVGTTTLADGTTYIAEPGAKVSVLGPRRLRIEGAALLDVAPGQGTFVVETARGTIEVLGTRFLVDGQAERTTTAVVRGEVRLASSTGDVVLHAGEQGIAEPGRPVTRGPAPRLTHLVSWAQQARRAEEHDVQPLHHGTLFARDPGVRSHPPWGSEYPLPITELRLDVAIDDQVARVALDQTFRNETNEDLEGVYRFAIPPDAALQRLAMYVDGRLQESAVVERMQARRIYEELVYRRVDPALLEWAGTGRLSLRVYPIPARQDKRLMLAYTQSLPKLYDDWTLTVPLPEVDTLVGNMDVAVRVKGCANCELTSTSHAVTVERTGDDAVVHYQHGGEKLGDSFVLHVRDTRHQTTVATHSDGDGRYLLVRAPVDLGHKAVAYKPRTWIVLDDVSASRGASELHAQRDLVDALVREVDENDKLAVVAFDVQARTLLAPTRAMDIDRRTLRKAFDNEGGVGATDFQAALDAATKLLDGVDPETAYIVYLGDGLITAGPRNLDALRAQLVGKAHFIGVGVGDGPDTQTLGGLAAATGGYATTFDLADDLGWRTFDLVAALHTARVTKLEAKLVDRHGTLVPATSYLGSQQLADGEELELVGKLAGDQQPVAVELTGTLDGAPWQQRIELDTKSHDGGYLPRMWAQRQIAARLLVKHEAVATTPCMQSAKSCPTEAEVREARDEQIRREVVGLGKKYFLLSRHTSLLVLENDAMYKQYNVEQGAGDTWAPYALPATIKVNKLAAPDPKALPANVAPDAELVRAPLQVFYQPYGGFGLEDGEFDFHARDRWGGWQGNRAAPMTISGEPTGVWLRRGVDEQIALEKTTVAITTMPVSDSTVTLALDQPVAGVDLDGRIQVIGTGNFGTIGMGAGGGGTGQGMGGGRNHWGDVGGATLAKRIYWNGQQQVMATRLVLPTDQMFDDITAFVPALFADAADGMRRRLVAGSHHIDDAARTLLADARRALPTGVYRWGDRELAIDDARHLAWRTTTDNGLVETASYDGATWTRRYAELGLDVIRAVSDDDITLGLAYLPVWIADPAHYAKYFDVTAKGREVTLSTTVRGKSRVAFVMSFDDQHRLVRIAADNDRTLVEITWGTTGPTAARVGGEKIAVGFIGDALTSATAWAHRDTQAGTLVELPGHLVDYWQKQIAAMTVGSQPWRHAQRQLLVAAAAVQNRQLAFATFDALRQHGGVELGDLALASGGVATATSDAQFTEAIAPFSQTTLARYLAAGRAYTKQAKPGLLAPATRDGVVGALWQLRSITAQLAARDPKAAADALAGMSATAPALRLLAAAGTAQHYDLDANQLVRLWDAVASGPSTNVARAMAAQLLFSRGQYDAAAERVTQLVDQLDLDAPPAQLANLQYMFNSSRRGQAGWELVYATWRNRVVAGNSYAHAMALLPAAVQHNDTMIVLGRAADLAAGDPAKAFAVASAAMSYGQSGYAENIIRPLLAKAPSRDLYQLAAQIAQNSGKVSDALADLEAAQDLAADDAANINVVRNELGQLIGVAQRLAQQSSGAERERAVKHAQLWAKRWRDVDPGNTAIDRQLGELLLSVGDNAGAWRQLSSTIERDPWSSAGYMTVAEAFEHQGKVGDALPFWQQAIVIDQTNPTPRLRKAQALIALGKSAEGDQLLHDITSHKWHEIWSGVVYQAQELQRRGQH